MISDEQPSREDEQGSAEAVHRFLTELRSEGLTVPTGSALLHAEALALLPEAPDAMYWAGRATLAHGPEEIAIFDRVFTRYWLGATEDVEMPVEEQSVNVGLDDGVDDNAGGDDRADDEPLDLAVRFSPTEVLRTRDFALLDRSEQAEVNRLMADLRLAGALRRSHRRVPSRGTRGRPDLRRTVRAALRAGGEPVRRRTTVAGTRPRRVVLLADVSGSMEPYSRALVRFAHVAVAARAKVEAFTIGTRLTRLTRELTTRDPDAALARAAAAVPDWSGGTRLGEALRRFNDDWGVRGLARGAVVVILSDGWDRGDPAALAEEMARLHRVAHRIVWVNPLKAAPDYEPLARGMAAALPYVDVFLEGHALDSLEELARVVASDDLPSAR